MSNKKFFLVIDACIANAAGNSVHPFSSNSRNLLEKMTIHRHFIVLNKKLMTEWKAHQSKYSATWLAQMISRKQYKFINNHSENVTNYLYSNIIDFTNKEKAILKDVHLIDLALAVGNFIASNDDSARAAFCSLSLTLSELNSVLWINPINDAALISDILSNTNKYIISNQNYLIEVNQTVSEN